jgi:hypothetical protein
MSTALLLCIVLLAYYPPRNSDRELLRQLEKWRHQQ